MWLTLGVIYLSVITCIEILGRLIILITDEEPKVTGQVARTCNVLDIIHCIIILLVLYNLT